MRLADLLAELGTEDLERLAHEHARADEHLPRPQLLDTIEGVLRSYRFLQEFLFNRQPPTFAILSLLLDEPDYSLAADGFRETVLAETSRISVAVETGAILRRDDQLRIYRKVLYQARSNDMQIDASEAAILGVLRQELDVALVEHFLIEHHPELREFWDQDGAFPRELHELRSAGLVFVRDGRTILPEDLASIVRQVLGLEMSRPAARRLFDLVNHSDLHQALELVGAPTSGSKEERIERLVAHMASPRSVIACAGLDTLKDVCRKIGARVSGSKEEIVDRIVTHVAAGRDLRGEPDEAPPAIEEPRHLERAGFESLFETLPGHQLAAILGEFGLRRWGTKSVQLATLWESNRSEVTLLGCLRNPELDDVLERLELRRGGSKPERIKRLVDHFALAHLPDAERTPTDRPPAG